MASQIWNSGWLGIQTKKPLNISTVENFYERVFYEIQKFLTCASDGTFEKVYVRNCKIVRKCEKVLTSAKYGYG